MESIKFRFSKLTRWFNLLFVTLLGVSILLLGFVISIMDFNLSCLLIIPMIITVVWITRFEWSYFIEFRKSELVFIKHRFLNIKQTKIPYSEILSIGRSIQDTFLEVHTRNGKSYQLYTSIDGGTNALITEFQKHLQSDQIQPKIRKFYKKLGLYEKYWISICLACILIFSFTPSTIRLSIFNSWKTEWPPLIYSPGYIQSFWLNNNHEIWLSYLKVFRNKDWEIVQLRSNGDLVSFSTQIAFEEYPGLILADDAGQPWIITFDTLSHWVGSNWQEIVLDKYILFYESPPVVIKNDYWVIGYDENLDKKFLVRLNLNTGLIITFDLPKEFDFIGNDFFYARIYAGEENPILMVTKKFHPIYFFSFINGQWEKESEILEVPLFATEYLFQFSNQNKLDLRFIDATVTQNDSIFVLLERDQKYIVGKLVRSTGEWIWSDVEDKCNSCLNHYYGMIVDKSERVWLSGTYRNKEDEDENHIRKVDVFNPVWGSQAKFIVRYTTRNSGFQIGYRENALSIDQQGYIWGGDNRLVWIDSTQANLPKPLPYEFMGDIPLFPLLILTHLIFYMITNHIILKWKKNFPELDS